MRDQAGEKEETEEAGSGETTVRWNREEKERKKQRPSSEKLKLKGTKGNRGQAEAPKRKGDHLWNGCGSEAGKNERKPSEKPSTRSGKERMRNQAKENVEDEGSESGEAAPIKPLRGRSGKNGKEETES